MLAKLAQTVVFARFVLHINTLHITHIATLVLNVLDFATEREREIKRREFEFGKDICLITIYVTVK